MPQPPLDESEKVLWNQVLANNRAISNRVYGQSLESTPEPNEIKSLTTDQYALQAAKAQGWREAVNYIFKDIPNDRSVPDTSPFIDTSISEETGEA